MAKRKLVVLGLLGHQLDGPFDRDRWNRWRPTVSLCQHEELLVDSVELLFDPAKQQRQFAVVRDDIAAVSPETRVTGHAVTFEDPWDFEEVYARLYEFARAYHFDTEQADYLVHITTGTHVVQICLFLLTETRHLPARLIQTSPPSKRRAGVGTYRQIDLDLARYDQIASRFAAEHREGVSLLKSGIETRDPAFNRQIELIEQVAQLSRAPILLMGPTGAGKSQLASRIFELRRQRHQLEGPFVEVNCATLRGDTAMSTVFGHKQGALTGAVADRPGLLLAADGGVLLLDEIGELGLDEQAMLLRALEDRRFLPVGSDREVESDFHLIAGTNRDLNAWVAEGHFREDLLARINLWSFTLPGLRERVTDIEPNLRYELEQFSQQSGRRVTFNKEARETYLRFATSSEAEWIGNFRDLNASVTRMATLAAGGRIGRSLVDDEIERVRSQWSGRLGRVEPTTGLVAEVLGDKVAVAMDRFDRVQLEDVLQLCRQSRSLSEAGRRLFAESRKHKRSANDADRLRKYLARFGLSFAAL